MTLAVPVRPDRPRQTAPRAGAEDTGRWLICRAPRPDARATLYCFPHAGGSPGEYARWSDQLLGARIYGVQAPGRGSRAAEPPAQRMPELVDAFCAAVAPEAPYVLFGHSLGALVAFEVARALRARGYPAPARLIVSSSPAPPLPPRAEMLHTLPDAALLEEVSRRFGGLPAAVLRDPELRVRAAALHRADLSLVETHRLEPDEPLDCPITTVVGDEELDRVDMSGWARHTRTQTTAHVLPGGHFYLREQRPALLRLLDDALTAAEPPDNHTDNHTADDTRES